MKHAINQLQTSLEVVETNEPIHRGEGNNAQADLEAASARSFRKAIAVLQSIDTVVQTQLRT